MHLLAQFPTTLKNLAITLCMILNTGNLFAQTFQTAIGYAFPTDERGASGLITNAGDYLILADNINHPAGLFNPAGDMELLRLDNFGNLILPSKIVGQDVGESSKWIEKAIGCAGNAGYIIAGNEYNGGNSNMLLTFTNTAGTPQWVKRIGTQTMDEVSACVKQDGSNNFILVGTKTDPNTGQSAIHAVKTDCAGNLLWERVYRVNGSATTASVTAFATFQSPCGTLPNEYFITGKVNPAAGGNEEVFILSVNVVNGNVSWMKTYDVAPNAGDVATCIQGRCAGPAPAVGQLWVSGYSLENSGSDPEKVLMLQTDITGNLQWANNYDVQNSVLELATHFQFAANNKLVLTGKAEDSGVSDPPENGQCLLMRIDDNGSGVDWTRVYTLGFASQGNRVEPTAADEYFITGHTYEIIQIHQFDYNVLAIKTDQLGETKSGCYHSPATKIMPRQPLVTSVQPTPIIPQDFFATGLQTVLIDDKQTFCPNTPIDPCDTLGLVAAFSFTNSGNTYSFTDLSNPGSGSIFSWTWDFGDANTSNLQYPVHTYSGPGVYTVCLIITGGTAGMICHDTICKDIIVEHQPIDPCDTMGVSANFTFSVSGNTVTFTDLSTIASGNIIGWDWYFGDAGTSNIQNPAHTYTNTGVYTVCLVVAGFNSASATICRDTICKDIFIEFLTDGCLCDSSFYAAVALGFTTSGTNPIGFTPVGLDTCDKVLWLWGDASPNSNSVGSATVFHTYTAAGTYSVCMVVTRTSIDGKICSREYCTTIHVTTDPDLCEGNIVKNGSFEAGLVAGNLGSGGAINNWTTWTNTPQVILFDTCQDAGAVQMWGDQVVGESIQQPVTFQAGGIYEVTFCGKWLPTVQDSVRFRFRASNGLPGSYFNCSGSCDEMYLSPILTTSWVTYTSAPWIATQNFNTLTISVWNNFNLNDGAYVSWARIDDVCIRRIGTSATSDVQGQIAAKLFPNPTSGDVIVQFGAPLDEETMLTVMDLTGKKVLQTIVPQGETNQRLALNNCPAGVYVVRALCGGRSVWVEKVVKE